MKISENLISTLLRQVFFTNVNYIIGIPPDSITASSIALTGDWGYLPLSFLSSGKQRKAFTAEFPLLSV